jgi:hypothetical protein
MATITDRAKKRQALEASTCDVVVDPNMPDHEVTT